MRSLRTGLTSRFMRPAPLSTLSLLIAANAFAAIQVSQTTVSEGLGGFGNASSTSTVVIDRDRSRSEEESKYTGRFKTFAGGKRTRVTITRLDLEVLWNLDPKKKEYTETTFAELREILSGKGGAFGIPQTDEPDTAEKVAEVEMDCTMKVDRTEGTQEINGFSCHHALLTVRCDPKDPALAAEKGARPMKLAFDLWLTRDVPGLDEMQAFQKAYFAKLGMGTQFATGSAMARRLAAKAMEEMKDELEKLEGYPIRSTFVIEQAPMSEEQKLATQKAMAEAEADEKQAEKQAQADAAAQAASGNRAGAATTLIGSKIGGMFSKKARESSAKSAEAPVFKVVTEVTGIRTLDAAGTSFDHEGFKKIEKPR